MKSLRDWWYCWWGPRVFVPLACSVFVVVAWLGRVPHIHIGKLSIWGPQPFLDLCKTAVERLQAMDSSLLRCLTEVGRLWCIPGPWPGVSRHIRIFSVSEEWMAWECQGVVARLVYIAYYLAAYPPPVRTETPAAAVLTRRTVLAQTRAWVEAHGFSPQLVECFAEQNLTR